MITTTDDVALSEEATFYPPMTVTIVEEVVDCAVTRWSEWGACTKASIRAKAGIMKGQKQLSQFEWAELCIIEGLLEHLMHEYEEYPLQEKLIFFFPWK